MTKVLLITLVSEVHGREVHFQQWIFADEIALQTYADEQLANRTPDFPSWLSLSEMAKKGIGCGPDADSGRVGDFYFRRQRIHGTEP